MIELWAREGASFKTEEKAEEACGKADAQTDILVINVNQHTIDNELSNHCEKNNCAGQHLTGRQHTQLISGKGRKSVGWAGRYVQVHLLSKHSHHQYSTCESR